MNRFDKAFFEGVRQALRALYGRESGGDSGQKAVIATTKSASTAAAHPGPDSDPDCPQCHLPWGYHPQDQDGAFECHLFFETEAER